MTLTMMGATIGPMTRNKAITHGLHREKLRIVMEAGINRIMRVEGTGTRAMSSSSISKTSRCTTNSSNSNKAALSMDIRGTVGIMIKITITIRIMMGTIDVGMGGGMKEEGEEGEEGM